MSSVKTEDNFFSRYKSHLRIYETKSISIFVFLYLIVCIMVATDITVVRCKTERYSRNYYFFFIGLGIIMDCNGPHPTRRHS